MEASEIDGKKLLAALLQEPQQNLAQRIKRVGIDRRHVDGDMNKHLFDTLYDILEIGDQVARASFEAHIKQDGELSNSDKRALLDYIERLMSVDYSGVIVNIEALNTYKAKQRVIQTFGKYTQHMSEGKDVFDIVDGAQEDIRKIKDDADNYTVRSYLDTWHIRENERATLQEDGSGLTMAMVENLSPFAANFPNKLQACEVTAFSGPTYSGKSTLLTNGIRVAAHPTNGLNVLYVFAENRRIQAESRLDAIMLDKPYDELRQQREGREEWGSFFEDALDDGWGHIMTTKVHIGGFDANTLANLMDQANEQLPSGESVEVMAVDSPNHQKPVASFDEFFLRKKQVYEENKALAAKNDLIFLATLPMKPSSKKGEKVDNEDAAGSYSIARLADNVIMFNVDDMDRKINRGRLEVTKARDGQIEPGPHYMYFEPSNRMVPWTQKFGGTFDPNPEEDEVDDMAHKINQYVNDDAEYEQEAGFNVRKE